MNLSAWRVGLRIARRDALRHKARSALVVVMIGLPILGVVTADVLFRSSQLTASEQLPRKLGDADALVTGVYGGTAIEQAPDGSTWGSPADVSGSGPAPAQPAPLTLAQVRAVLPAGSQVAPWRTDGGQIHFGDAPARSVTVDELDYTSPVAAGIIVQEAGRAPRTDPRGRTEHGDCASPRRPHRRHRHDGAVVGQPGHLPRHRHRAAALPPQHRCRRRATRHAAHRHAARRCRVHPVPGEGATTNHMERRAACEFHRCRRGCAIGRRVSPASVSRAVLPARRQSAVRCPFGSVRSNHRDHWRRCGHVCARDRLSGGSRVCHSRARTQRRQLGARRGGGWRSLGTHGRWFSAAESSWVPRGGRYRRGARHHPAPCLAALADQSRHRFRRPAPARLGDRRRRRGRLAGRHLRPPWSGRERQHLEDIVGALAGRRPAGKLRKRVSVLGLVMLAAGVGVTAYGATPGTAHTADVAYGSAWPNSWARGVRAGLGDDGRRARPFSCRSHRRVLALRDGARNRARTASAVAAVMAAVAGSVAVGTLTRRATT